MRTLKVASKVAAVLVALVMLGGCCQEQERKIGVLTLANGELQKRLIDEERKAAVLGERIDALRGSGDQVVRTLAAKDQAIRMLQDRNATLESQLAAANKSYADLVAKVADSRTPAGGGTLPPTVGRKLKALAATYPGLLTFDATSGQLRFSSDVTFDLGKADLKANASEALAKLAMILTQGEEAKPIQVAIVGHTCTTRIAKAETKRLFGDNQGLSEARAKSVGDLLSLKGVEASRLSTSGVGSNQLLDKANPKSGRNRRVEIFLSMP